MKRFDTSFQSSLNRHLLFKDAKIKRLEQGSISSQTQRSTAIRRTGIIHPLATQTKSNLPIRPPLSSSSVSINQQTKPNPR